MKYCDLHNHSVHSDGSFTPRELVEYAKEKGLFAIGLTDHNTSDGMEEFIESAKELSIDYVCGNELTTDYNNKEVHLLCLFITPKNVQKVRVFTDEQLKNKKVSNVDLANNLRNGGYDITIEELYERFGKNLNRAHFARVLVDKGYAESTDVAFDTFLKSGNGFYNPPARLDLLDAIELVISWGCLPVIAHPLLSLTREELEEVLPRAKEKGLVGLEVYYPKFNDEMRNYLYSLCQKYDLVASGGSDFHGSMKSYGDLNDAKAPYECYENLLKRLK